MYLITHSSVLRPFTSAFGSTHRVHTDASLLHSREIDPRVLSDLGVAESLRSVPTAQLIFFLGELHGSGMHMRFQKCFVLALV